jgi:hypothetical protein
MVADLVVDQVVEVQLQPVELVAEVGLALR